MSSTIVLLVGAAWRRWYGIRRTSRVQIRHVVHTADDGYRRVDHVAVVEPE